MDLFNMCMDIYQDCMDIYNECMNEEQHSTGYDATEADAEFRKVDTPSAAKSTEKPVSPTKFVYGIPEIKTIGVNEKKGIVVVVFADGTKTSAKCAKDDSFDVNVGVALAIAERLFGSKSKYHKVVTAKSPKSKISSDEMAALRAKQHDLETQLNEINKTIRKKREGKA